jgi:4'-phosphopantetheinyl transferase
MTTGASLSDLPARGKPRGESGFRPERIVVSAPGVCVWQAPLDVDASELASCAAALSADELERAARLRASADRHNFIVTRARLRELLADCIGTRPEAIRFGYTPRGKPYLTLPATPLHFSVSHAGNRAVFALARNCQPGIDLECLDRKIDLDGVARRFFTANENAALRGTPDFGRQCVFMAIWTRKEALVKALGDGLAFPLHRLEVSTAPEADPAIIAAADPRVRLCTLHRVTVASGYFASLATYDGSLPVAQTPNKTARIAASR